MTNISLRIPSYFQRSSNKLSAYVLFLVWPFFSVIYAIVNYRSPWAKNIIWLFSGFFGFTFVISNEGMDANSYRFYLEHLHESEITFSEFFIGVYQGIYSRGDYLEPTIRYLISLFTDDYRILFCVFGLIMGYFYSRNIWFLIDETKGRIKTAALPFLLIFIFLVPFWLINGFRFWTATHMFVYGVICLFYFRKFKIGTLALLLSALTHIAFLLPCGIVVGYFFIPKNGWLFILILLISILFLRFDLTFFINLIPSSLIESQLPVLTNYLNEGYAEARSNQVEALHWYARYKDLPIYLYAIATTVILVVYKIRMTKNRGWIDIFYFGVLLFSTTTVLNVIPSAARLFSVAYLFIFGAFFLLVQREKLNASLQWYFILGYLVIALPVAIQIRIGMDFIGPNTLLYNPLFAWILGNEYALVHFYKGIG